MSDAESMVLWDIARPHMQPTVARTRASSSVKLDACHIVDVAGEVRLAALPEVRSMRCSGDPDDRASVRREPRSRDAVRGARQVRWQCWDRPVRLNVPGRSSPPWDVIVHAPQPSVEL